jgi:hypothetical protein
MHFDEIARIKMHRSLSKAVGRAARKPHKFGENIVFLTPGRRLSDMLQFAF